MSIVSDFATENYLKVIVKNLSESGRDRLGTGELARLMGLTPGTVTTMTKKLEKSGYLNCQSHHGCSLTEEGKRYGIRILRRHRLLELFLVQTLKLDWTEVHEEAENLEHAVSEKLIDSIDAFLGHPRRDPHGDPIPTKFQSDLTPTDRPFTELATGEEAQISRVEGQKSLLEYYRDEGLVPGARVVVVDKNTAAGLAKIQVDGKSKQLALSAFGGMYVDGTTADR